METAAILRSFHGAILPNQEALLSSQKPCPALKTTPFSRGLAVGRGLTYSRVRQIGCIEPFAKAAETASACEAVGCGDPLVAVLPSFYGIK